VRQRFGRLWDRQQRNHCSRLVHIHHDRLQHNVMAGANHDYAGGAAPPAAVGHGRLRLRRGRADLSGRETRPAVSATAGFGWYRRARRKRCHCGINPQRLPWSLRSRPLSGQLHAGGRHPVGLAPLPGQVCSRTAGLRHPRRRLLRHRNSMSKPASSTHVISAIDWRASSSRRSEAPTRSSISSLTWSRFIELDR
jgi:hypothetical protein